ncbi:MAG: hypothetical protein WAN71_14680 [Mycobacterium sp.]
MPTNAFAKAFAQHGTAEEHAVLAAVQRLITRPQAVVDIIAEAVHSVP